MTILSCAYWPLICWPLRSDCPSLLPIFYEIIFFFLSHSLLRVWGASPRSVSSAHLLCVNRPRGPVSGRRRPSSSHSPGHISPRDGLQPPFRSLSSGSWTPIPTLLGGVQGQGPINLSKTDLFPLPTQLCLVRSLFVYRAPATKCTSYHVRTDSTGRFLDLTLASSPTALPIDPSGVMSGISV